MRECSPAEVMRLQRLLARAGIASRRKAEALIVDGRVRVDGRVASLGESVDPERHTVTVDGRAVRLAAQQWFALHKPVGVAVTRRDPTGCRTVFDFLPAVPGLTYVGRLDVMTSGLLLFTTDGAAVHGLTHPRFAVPRTYRVLVRGKPRQEIQDRLRHPIVIGGRPAVAVRYRTRTLGSRIEVELTLTEGRNRIVRRMCDAMGLTVERLQRVQFGPIRLGRLGPGHYRTLTARDVRALEKTWKSKTQRS